MQVSEKRMPAAPSTGTPMAIGGKDELRTMPEDTPRSARLPFRLARFLSWISLVLILGSSLFLAVFIGDSARDTLINRQQEFNHTLGSNLSQQIVRRFIWPTAQLTGGRINLTDPVQYGRLDQIISESSYGISLIHLRIYGGDKIINYSLDRSELGRGDLSHSIIEQCMAQGRPMFVSESGTSWIKAMFMPELPSGTFTLRMAFPLILAVPVTMGMTNMQTVGTLELIRDITEDYVAVVHLQWIILIMCLVSSAILFTLLQVSIRKAEGILAERMAMTRRMAAKIHENERMASMGRVISSIAHEIRNPLGIIRSSAELLLRRTKEEDATNKKILSAVYDESCRLSQIVNDFLDYARPKTPKKDTFNLVNTIDQTLGFLEGELKRCHVAIDRQYLPETLSIVGDRDLLYRAIYNIISNSLQAMSGGGTILISGKERKDGCCELLIRDTGPGFPPDSLSHVLDPFFTTKDHGTGLGLAIVNTIISGHGGQLMLSNPIQGGAATHITLPASTSSENKA